MRMFLRRRLSVECINVANYLSKYYGKLIERLTFDVLKCENKYKAAFIENLVEDRTMALLKD